MVPSRWLDDGLAERVELPLTAGAMIVSKLLPAARASSRPASPLRPRLTRAFSLSFEDILDGQSSGQIGIASCVDLRPVSSILDSLPN